MTGAADPTFNGQLRIVVMSDLGDQSAAPFSADIGVYYTSEGLNWLVCALESSNNSVLVNSIVGVGVGPLPFG